MSIRRPDSEIRQNETLFYSTYSIDKITELRKLNLTNDKGDPLSDNELENYWLCECHFCQFKDKNLCSKSCCKTGNPCLKFLKKI